MVNKRGQGLSTNTLILIILGVIVLVVLAVGFTMGWDKIAPWIGGGSNVDTIKQQCSVACSTGATYDYCSASRNFKSENKPDNRIANCSYFSKNAPYNTTYGFEACPTIPCNQ